MPQIAIEIEKNSKKNRNISFYAIFVKFLIHSLAWKVENIQQGKMMLFKKRRRKDKCNLICKIASH